MREVLVKISNIPQNTAGKLELWTYLPRKGCEAAYFEALQWVSNEPPKHPFITFTGGAGLGKTHLALGIGWHWLRNCNEQVRYYQAQDLLDQIQASFNAIEAEAKHSGAQILNAVKVVPLLILDDLGAERSTEWAMTTIDAIINARYVAKLRTVVTTNARSENLPPRVSSRLKEGVTCVLSGSDYRAIIGAAVNAAPSAGPAPAIRPGPKTPATGGNNGRVEK